MKDYANLIMEHIYLNALNQEKRDYLGVSVLGDKCPMAVYLYNLFGEEDVLSPTSAMIYNEGNLQEAIILDYLAKVEVEVSHTQLELSYLDGKIKGHIDGVLDGTILVDFKSASEFSYQKFKEIKNSNNPSMELKKYNPKYYYQLQIYRYLMELQGIKIETMGDFIKNKSTGAMLFLEVNYDKQEAIDKLAFGEKIVNGYVPKMPDFNIIRDEMNAEKKLAWEIKTQLWKEGKIDQKTAPSLSKPLDAIKAREKFCQYCGKQNACYEYNMNQKGEVTEEW